MNQQQPKMLSETLPAIAISNPAPGNDSATLCRKANQALEEQREELAIELFNETLKLNPRSFEALNGLGNILYENQTYRSAYACLQRLAEIDPTADRLFNLSLSQRALHRYEQSLASLKKALKTEPHNPRVLLNIGRNLMDLLRFDEAIPYFGRAYALDSSLSLAAFNESHCFLAAGDFERGWPIYERRALMKDTIINSRFSGKRWQGQQISGPLLVGYEQGRGDLIQFVRYAFLARKRCDQLVLQAPESLCELMQTVPGVDVTVPSESPATGFEYHIPVGSLPGLICAHPLSNPISVPYIKVPVASLEKTARILSHLNPGHRRVGLVWAGAPGYGRDIARSLPLQKLLPLLEIPGIDFISLQHGKRSEELAASGLSGLIFDASPHLKTFTETAAFISQIDLLISCDTSVAHLAGALGKPVWILTERRADWRWMTKRDDHPFWYPTARVFRQEFARQWQAPLQRLVHALKHHDWDHPVAKNNHACWNELCYIGHQAYVAGNHAKALDLFANALQLNPDSVEALDRLGIALMEQQRYRAALVCVRRAAKLRPDTLHLQNLGTAIRALSRREPDALCRYEEAIAAFAAARNLAPQHDRIIYELGLSLKHILRFDEAIECFQKVIDLGADHTGLPTFDMATSYLSKGDFERGWELYEQRIRMENYRKHKPPLPQPLWKGEKIAGTMVLVAEQGMGDMMQLIRFAPKIRKRCDRLIAEAPVGVMELFLTAPGIDAVIPSEDINPTGYDAYVSYGSLPHIFKYNPLTSPPTEIPYLGVCAARVEAMARWLAPLGTSRRRIGIVWSGSPTYQSDNMRSLPLKSFLPLLEIPDVALVSLQYGKRGRDHLQECGINGLVLDMSEHLRTFSDTAAVILNLDLVISCDTSVGHLAGALNKPVWILLRKESEWRWMTESEHSPWYPSMRLFRQEYDRDWRHPIRRIVSILKNMPADMDFTAAAEQARMRYDEQE